MSLSKEEIQKNRERLKEALTSGRYVGISRRLRGNDLEDGRKSCCFLGVAYDVFQADLGMTWERNESSEGAPWFLNRSTNRLLTELLGLQPKHLMDISAMNDSGVPWTVIYQSTFTNTEEEA